MTRSSTTSRADPRRSVSPDCYVVFGLSDAALRSLSLEGNNTYLLWEVGKPPDFILEIGSRSTARADLGSKRELYAEIGVGEYWRYDATGGERSTASLWWESAWWMVNIVVLSCGMRVTAAYGLTVKR